MRRLIACALLLVCLASPFAGQNNDEWHRYKNEGGNFSVLLPVEPKEDVSEGAPVTHTIQAVSGGIGYTVVYVVAQSEQTVDEPTFKVYRDAFLRGLPSCALVSEDAAAPAIRGYVGHWYRMNCNIENQKMSLVGNLYWGKHYAYAVFTIFQTDASDPPSAKKFPDSFALLDADK